MWGPQVGAPGVLKSLPGHPQGREDFHSNIQVLSAFFTVSKPSGGLSDILQEAECRSRSENSDDSKNVKYHHYSHCIFFVIVFLFLFSLNFLFSEIFSIKISITLLYNGHIITIFK